MRWIRAGLAAALALAFAGGMSLFLLALADFEMAGNGSPDPVARAEWVIQRGDHLHFAVHLTLGRVFDLCPCTRRAAGAQYFYAHFHALTPNQRQVVSNTNPRTPAEWAEYVTGPLQVGIDWIGDGIRWLRGNRPKQEARVDIDADAFEPAEIRIVRGTTVTWRNVDEFGEAHTVTADPGQVVRFDSNWLLPDESFQFTFTERGRFVYSSRDGVEPDVEGASGVVIVE